MTLLITGGSGYLGRSLCRRARRDHRVVAGFHRHRPEDETESYALDLSQPAEARARILALAPRTIVHTAAVNPGGDERRMEPVNVDGSRAVAAAAATLGARLIHVSTDVVHDGSGAPYADDAATAPVGLYAQTKAAAETAVLTEVPTATIVRTSLIYGLDAIDHGTASFVRRLEAGEPVRLFADVLRQPVWVESLADALARLVDSDFTGFLNVAGSQVLSRDRFGRQLLDWWRVPGRERVETVRAEDLGLNVPRDLRLRLERAREILGVELPGVDEVLELRGPQIDPSRG